MKGVQYLGIGVKCLRLTFMFSAEKTHGAAVGLDSVARDSWSQWSWCILYKPRKEELGEGHSWVMQSPGSCVLCVSACSCCRKGRASASVISVNVQLTELLQEDPWQTNTIFGKPTYPLSFA